jgi:alpha-beta hydrolase superfamily lysophospholipase
MRDTAMTATGSGGSEHSKPSAGTPTPALDLSRPWIARIPLPRTSAQFPHIALADPAVTAPFARVAWFPSTNGPASRVYLLFVGTAEAIEKHQPAVDDIRARGRDVLVFEFTGAGDSGRFLTDPLKVHSPRRGFDFWMASIGEFLDGAVFASVSEHARAKGASVVAMPYSLGGLHFARLLLREPDHARHFSHVVYINPALVFKSAGASTLARHWAELKGRAAVLVGQRDAFVPGHGRDPADRPVTKSPLALMRRDTIGSTPSTAPIPIWCCGG